MEIECHEEGLFVWQNNGRVLVYRYIPEHGSASFFAHRTSGSDRQVALLPLMRHEDVAILVLDYIPAHTGQRRPLAVGDRFRRTPLVHFALAHFTGEAVRGDTRQCISADVTIRRSDVARSVPVMVVAEEVGLVAGAALKVFISAAGRGIGVGWVCGEGGGAGSGMHSSGGAGRGRCF